MTRSVVSHGLRHIAALSVAICSGLGVVAQQSPAGEDEEVVELSPFVISTNRDVGWVASSTLVGNRTNTALVNVPASIDAITSEFMQDLGAYTLEDTALWVANLDVVNELETAAEEQRVNYRGMQLGGREVPQSSRNFFSWFTPTDTYNIDRIDFSKGSNSLMFGDSTPGGMATSYTKRANIGNSFGKITARVDSEGSHRVQLDYNQHLNDKLAARINIVSRDDRSYMDFAHSSLNAVHGTVTYRPFANTLIRAEAEFGEFKRKRASNLLKIRETPAPGLGFSSNNRWYVTSDGDIIHRTASNPPAVDRTGAGGLQLSLMEGQSVTVTLPDGTTKTFTGYDKDVNLKGTIDYLDRPYDNFSLFLEQKIGDLHMEVAYNNQNQQQDRIDATFGTTVSVDGDGRPFLDSELNRREFGDRVQVLRVSASYPFEFRDWTKQFLVVSGEYQKHRLENFRQNLANFAVLDNGPTNIANHRIMARAYLDDPAFPSSAFWDQFLPENLPQTATFRPGWYETTSETLPFVDDRFSRSVNASLAGEYWNGRIRSLLGIRHDGFDRKLITDLPTDEIGQSIFLGYPSEVPEAYSYLPEFDLDNTTYSSGLVFGLTESANIYATYSESFRWQAATDFTDEALGPELGETKEVGIKAFFMDNKLAATVAFYEIEQFNSRFVWNPNLLSTTEMEELFNPNNLAPSSPDYFLPSQGLNSEFRTVTSSEHAKGVEFTLQLQRWHGLQARVTYSHNKLGITRDFTKFRAMYEAARQRTDQALAGGNPAMAENEALLADALAILEANDGVTAVTGSRSVPDSVNWLLDYKLPRGFLGDTRVALYGNWRSDYNIELIGGQMFRGGGSHPIGAYIIHQRRIMDRPTSFRLGLRNIVDLENSGDLRRVGVVRVDANNVPTDYEYRYLTPFSVDFSITVDF